jgi:peptidoglycan-N-acetylglucosamine deacetylase
MKLKERGYANCTTSWDDGHPHDMRVADLLTKYGLTGTFYIPIENSRPVMAAREIRWLGETFEVGAHTTHHVVLTEVPEAFAEDEVRESKKRLEDITGSPCEAFCFPKGRFRRSHLNMVRRAGFRCARTVELLSIRFPIHCAGIRLIQTTVQANPHHWTVYAKNCAKRLSLKGLANLVLHAHSRNWRGTARSMLEVVAQHGGVFHLWGHSWEIDDQQQWPQLESVLRGMRELQSIIPCVPNSRLASQCLRDSVGSTQSRGETTLPSTSEGQTGLQGPPLPKPQRADGRGKMRPDE